MMLALKEKNIEQSPEVDGEIQNLFNHLLLGSKQMTSFTIYIEELTYFWFV